MYIMKNRILLIVVVLLVGYLIYVKCSQKPVEPFSNTEIRDKIIQFFKANPNPSDRQVHRFAKKLGINKHKFEEHIYALLTEYIK